MPPKVTGSQKGEEQAGSAFQSMVIPPTLRNRHGRKSKDPKSTEPTISPIAAANAATTTAASVGPQNTIKSSTIKIACLCMSLVVASLCVLLLVFIILQVMAVDNMDFRRTAARMDLAGRGQKWFPMWMVNFVVNSVTAVRVEVAKNLDGSSDLNGRPINHEFSGPPPPPPPRVFVKSTPVAEKVNKTDSSEAAPPVALTCYTLEDYSEIFLQAPRKTKTEHFFSCGTRVHDLRTEDRPDVVAACDNTHTTGPKTPTGNPIGSTGSGIRGQFPTLRVVLTPSEEQRHRALQPVNTVTQRIPLQRVNDDYCDCLDGTDELLTNACSMSGPLAPAASARWKSYLVSNQAIRLYDEPDLLEHDDMEARGGTPAQRKRGDVGDRLYVSQGPVLPFVCTCGHNVRQLLAPSLVGDGIVDCCNAEDEAALPHSPFALTASLPSHKTPPVEEAYDRAVATEKNKVLRQWRQRQDAVAAQVDAAVSYDDPLFPYYTSARALLVDRGYYSLFSPDVVQQERMAAATALRNLYARGHATQRRRVQKGWERLGQSLTENRTHMQMELANITRELEDLERFVQTRMEERRTNNPIEAGVSLDLLKHHDQLAQAHQGLRMELQHVAMTTLHHAYGDHYEYYPLVRRVLPMMSEKITDANTPSDLYSGIARDRARRYVTPSQLERLVMAAQQNGVTATDLLHIDNISVSHYGIELMRHTMIAQRFDLAEAPYVAQKLGLMPRRAEHIPFNPHVFDKISDPFLRAPVLPVGAWQPYRSERNGRSLQLADPTGDFHLSRRAFVTPASPLYRGGGRLQFPTRHPEPSRSVTVTDEEQEKKSLKEKLKAAAEGTAAVAKKIDIPHHFHTPSVFAVDAYMGQVRCDPDPLPVAAPYRRNPADDGSTDASSQQQSSVIHTVQTYVTFLCDTKDRVLYWGRNGKCTQEVIVGTPSTCTAWALKAARGALKKLSQRTPDEKRDEASFAEEAEARTKRVD